MSQSSFTRIPIGEITNQEFKFISIMSSRATSPATQQTTSFTLRNPPYTYLHLLTATHTNQSIIPSNPTSLDEITLRTHLNSALNQYLGLTGTAIPIDIFKVESTTGEAWVRIPRDDERAVVAALSQWVGKGSVVVRILGRGSWLGGLIGNDGVEDGVRG